MSSNGKGKKKSPGALIIGVIILVSLLSEAPEYVDEGVIGFIVMALILVFVFWSIIRAAKKSTKSGAEDRMGEHSHDRLTVSAKEVSECSGMEHWKEQLDGFLKAGLIDRNEYNVLLNRYAQDLQNRK